MRTNEQSSVAEMLGRMDDVKETKAAKEKQEKRQKKLEIRAKNEKREREKLESQKRVAKFTEMYGDSDKSGVDKQVSATFNHASGMTISLDSSARGQMIEIASNTENDNVVDILTGRRVTSSTDTIVSGRNDIMDVRNLAAAALDSGAAERYGFDRVNDVYENASDVLFGEN